MTEKRWFWPALCAVSVVFGWWYLSITTCAPLGGDDELINLQNYYYITHTSFGQSVLDYLGDLWVQFTLQNGRFPAVLLAAGARADKLVSGGSGRLPPVHSGVDLRGHCTDRMAGRQGVPQQKTGHCLPLPAADDVQRLAGLYGQQSVFLRCAGAKHAAARPCGRAGRALAGHRDKRWAVLAGYCAFQCCATF